MSACTPRNVQQVLKALESKGYVERKTNGSGRNMALTLPYDGWTTQPFTPTNSRSPIRNEEGRNEENNKRTREALVS